nr:ExeA family protein [Desulfovulcanus ferrireducens]
MWHGIETRKGFLVLMGEVGVGKTSLSLQLLARLKKEEIPFAWVFNTALNKIELFQVLAKDFGFPVKKSLSSLQDQFYQSFLKYYKENKNCVIVIDEAHNLSGECLEALRMLSNLEWEGQKLVQILLIGQPELKLFLDQPRMRQVRSRISIFLELPHLTREELKGYIDFKLANAESQFRITRQAINLLWNATKGNLRLVNLVMERSLYALFVANESTISRKIIKIAIEDVAIYQVDISRQLSQFRRKKRLMVLTSILVLLMCTTFFPLWELPEKGDVNLPSYLFYKLQEGLDSSGPIVYGKIVRQGEPAPGSKSASQVMEPAKDQDAIEREWIEFLQPWGVEELMPYLQQAKKYACVDLLRRHLPSGLQLLELDHIPGHRRLNWSALNWSKYVPDGPVWIVIWRPMIMVKEFCYRAKGPEITILQTLLRKLGYHTGRVDGIAGKKTWVAISDFQRDCGLPVTGYPDHITLFWLEQRGAK